MRKRIFKNITFFIVLVSILVLIPSFIYAANDGEFEGGGGGEFRGGAGASGGWEEESKERTLEITYPQIPGVSTPKTVSSGLPEYVDYIFRFATAIIGLIVLGVLIYNGFQYLTSVGKPEKLSDARQGIISALLGTVILFSAYLIFNTINPQLTILELPDPKIIEPVVKPGIYLCNKKAPDIHDIIETYKYGNQDESIDAAKELKDIMKNKKGSCYRVNFSANLTSFVFDQIKHTMFIIPRKEYVYNPVAKETKTEWRYDYGIIFHERDNWQGKCRLAKRVYEESITGSTGETFSKTRSVTIFRKPEIEPVPEHEGIILYECAGYNRQGTALCPPNIAGIVLSGSFHTGGADYYKFSKEKLSKQAENIKDRVLVENTRSVKIDPVGSYFAVMFSEDNFKGKTCEVISRNDINLLDNPIGRCGFGCNWFNDLVTGGTIEAQIKSCTPCLKSMIVVKGKVIY